MISRNARLLIVAIGLVSLAACSKGPARPGVAPPPPAAATRAEIDDAFELLMRGQEKEARGLLRNLLKRDPTSASARLLNDSILRDPEELLGKTSFSYTVRAGDTLWGVTQRFLGNPLKAYQLLRYNGLRAPAVLRVGQVMRIPGEAPRVEPVRRPEPPATPAAPAVTPKQEPKPAVPVAVRNPAAARTARAAGLAALNRGDVNRAVALLRRALALDPGNPAISRDLARAKRIAATVRARK